MFLETRIYLEFATSRCDVVLGELTVATIIYSQNAKAFYVKLVNGAITLRFEQDFATGGIARLLGLHKHKAVKITSHLSGADVCKCREGLCKESHSCSYREDRFQDHEFRCYCCEDCEAKCAEK